MKLLLLFICFAWQSPVYAENGMPSGEKNNPFEKSRPDIPDTRYDISPLHISVINRVDGSGVYGINMSGKISSGDYDRIVSIVIYKGQLPESINIDSPGGDVIEAIKLGKLVRRGLIQVDPSSTCNSACAFLVFSSINHNKGLYEEIGLHRPYYENEYFAGLTLNEAEKKYKELDDYVVSYLREMGVPIAVIEKIMSTPSNHIEHITMDEYIAIAGSRPPAFDEWLIAHCGSLSAQEMQDYSHAAAYEALHPYHTRRVIPVFGESSISKDYAKKGEMLSAGYRDYLFNRSNEIDRCEKIAVRKEQAKYVDELIKNNAKLKEMIQKIPPWELRGTP